MDEKRDAMKDLGWFFLILIGFGVLWAISGGLRSTASRLTNVTVTSDKTGVVNGESFNGQSISGQKSVNGYGEQIYTNSNSSGSSSGTPSSSHSTAQIAAIQNKSPFFDRVTLRSGNVGTSKASSEYVTLQASAKNTSFIDVTGWTLISRTSGASVSIGKGIDLPDSDQIPLNQVGEIYLRPGDTAYINTGRSPINGSFRTNKCIGFLNQFHSFNPSLNNSCPALKSEPLPPPPNNIDDRCLDYIDSYSSCKTSTGSLPNYLTHECQVFITDHESYGQCLNYHRNDNDFLGKTWRIYLNRDQTLWKGSREQIDLLDSNGKTVDEITY